MSVESDRFLASLRISLREFKSAALHLGLFVLCGAVLLPILIFGMSSIKGSSGALIQSYSLPKQVTFEHYIYAWTEGGFQHYMVNSIIVVGVSLALVLMCSTLAAYALTRFEFRGRYLVTAMILAGFMIPTQVLFIPRFVMMAELNLLNTRASLIIVYVASALPFSIFLLRQFFVGIPDSLADAAKLDGCSEFQIFYQVYLPLAIPAVSAVLVFQFVHFWNEFLYAISFVSSDALRTLPAGLIQFQGPYGTDWPRLMAGVGISVIPTILFFLLFRNQFIKSINMQAKG
jgi:raffinose/stachyose/melibiose transport system permease protein